jgi:hypothetical protein
MSNKVYGGKKDTKDAPSSGQITTGAKGANSVFSTGPEGAVRVGAYLNDNVNPNKVSR